VYSVLGELDDLLIDVVAVTRWSSRVIYVTSTRPYHAHRGLRVAAWLGCNAIAHISEVTLRRARLVLGWVTVSGFNSRCRVFISVCDQPPMSTQPGHPFIGRRNEYTSQRVVTPCSSGAKDRYGECEGGR